MRLKGSERRVLPTLHKVAETPTFLFSLTSFQSHIVSNYAPREFFYFLAMPGVACRILVSQPGIKPRPPTMEAQSPSHLHQLNPIRDHFSVYGLDL